MLATNCQRFFSVSLKQSATMKAQKIILNKKFDGFPTAANFKVVEENLPSMKEGEFLAQAEFISVDPYIRAYAKNVGETVIGEQVAKIIQSKNQKYPVGEYIVGEFGWRTHTIGQDLPGNFFKRQPKLLKGYEDLPKSLALGILGIPGLSGLSGFHQICKPEPGNVVVISAAGGAVGTTVGQLAKIHGCRVIGICGSDEKGQKLLKNLGYDAYINYKKSDFEQKLAEATPDQIDCYFDNVGGEISTSVLNRMKKFGRVAVCGSISSYNVAKPLAREVQTPVKVGHLVMEGFTVTRWRDEWQQSIDTLLKMIKEGKLNYFETVTEGFDNTPKAFIDMLQGENFGKAIVEV